MEHTDIQYLIDHNKRIQADGPKQPVYQTEQLQELWITIGRKLCPPTPENPEGYRFDQTARIMFERLMFSPSQPKGFYFFGTKGVGKTLNLDIYRHCMKALFPHTTMLAVEVTELEMRYKKMGADYLEGLVMQNRILILNDVGIESDLMDFGTLRNLVADLIMLRYRRFQVQPGNKMHMTGNLTWDAIGKKLGERIGERMREMLYPVYLEETVSHRK